MNKSDLINKLADVVSTKHEAEQVIELMVSTIKQTLSENQRVVISGFGSFNVLVRKAKRARNPKTGKIMTIMPHKTVKFKPAKELIKDITKQQREGELW
ncbi:MAG: HU family DNA-binding protein [Elusimicrobiota bacterium]